MASCFALMPIMFQVLRSFLWFLRELYYQGIAPGPLKSPIGGTLYTTPKEGALPRPLGAVESLTFCVTHLNRDAALPKIGNLRPTSLHVSVLAFHHPKKVREWSSNAGCTLLTCGKER